MRKDRLQRSEFVFYIAIDRKWMNKEQANQLLERARSEGLVEMDGGTIRPLFDVAEVSIPLGFKPTSDVLVKESPLRGTDRADRHRDREAAAGDRRGTPPGRRPLRRQPPRGGGGGRPRQKNTGWRSRINWIPSRGRS